VGAPRPLSVRAAPEDREGEDRRPDRVRPSTADPSRTYGKTQPVLQVVPPTTTAALGFVHGAMDA
jgi:hypothetical protein